MVKKKSGRTKKTVHRIRFPVVTIDPGQDTGYARFCSRIPDTSGWFTMVDEYDLFCKASKILRELQPRTVIIEKLFMKYNFKAFETLVREKMGWIYAVHALAKERGQRIPVLEVAASQWKYILGIGNATSPQIKEHSMWMASDRLGKKIRSEDEAAAICIGFWALENWEVIDDTV